MASFTAKIKAKPHPKNIIRPTLASFPHGIGTGLLQRPHPCKEKKPGKPLELDEPGGLGEKKSM
jgi:hypothetical protein